MTTPEDLKRAEEITNKIGKEFTYTESFEFDGKTISKIIGQALSEERERTLNSEAVQGLVNFVTERQTADGVTAKEIIEKFQQFREGK